MWVCAMLRTHRRGILPIASGPFYLSLLLFSSFYFGMGRTFSFFVSFCGGPLFGFSHLGRPVSRIHFISSSHHFLLCCPPSLLVIRFFQLGLQVFCCKSPWSPVWRCFNSFFSPPHLFSTPQPPFFSSVF